MNALDVAALIAAGKSAAEIAELCGVHLRTAYKLIARHRPPKAPAIVPPDFDRAAALNDAIDRAVIALADEGPAAVERLLNLARTAKLLGLKRQVGAGVFTHDGRPVRDALTDLMLAFTKEHPAAEKLAAEAREVRTGKRKVEPAPPPPPREPPQPAENPWLANLKTRSEWYGDATTKAPHEAPRPTSLETTKIVIPPIK